MFINSAEWKEGLPKKVRPSYSYRKEGSFSPRCQYRGEGHTVIGATPGLLILCAVRLETQNLLPSWEQKFHASRHNTQAAPKIISNLLRPPRGDGDYEATQKTGHPNDDSITGLPPTRQAPNKAFSASSLLGIGLISSTDFI